MDYSALHKLFSDADIDAAVQKGFQAIEESRGPQGRSGNPHDVRSAKFPVDMAGTLSKRAGNAIPIIEACDFYEKKLARGAKLTPLQSLESVGIEAMARHLVQLSLQVEPEPEAPQREWEATLPRNPVKIER